MNILYTILLNFLFLTVFNACANSDNKLKDIVEETLPAGAKSAEGIFTIGDDQNVLVGETVILQTSKLSSSKKFDSYTWKEDGKVLGNEYKLSIDKLSIGKHHISCHIKDKDGNVYVDIVTITIKKEDEKNHKPIADSFSISLDEDSDIITNLRGGDEDGNPLSYLFHTQPKHGTLSGSTAHLTYIPDSNYFGKDSFTFKTNDGTIDSNIATVSITINPINDAPVFHTKPTNKIVKKEETLLVAIDVSDADKDDLEFKVTPDWISFKNGQLNISPTADKEGIYHVLLEADDKHGAKSSLKFDLNIDTTKKIKIKPIESIVISEDNKTCIGEFHIEDEDDNKQIIYKISNYPEGFKYDNSHKFSLDLSKYQYLKKDENITFTIDVLASEGELTDHTDFNITILGKNDTPKFGNTTYPVAIEDELYDVDLIEALKITDADNSKDDFNITAKNLPNWLKLKDGKLIGTPTNDDVQHSPMITIIVSDGVIKYPPTSAAPLIVKNTNDAPVAHDDNISTDEDTPVTFNLLKNDIDIDKKHSLALEDINFTTQKGKVRFEKDGNITYNPNKEFENLKAGEEKNITFSYTMQDEYNATSKANVNITIKGKNDTPKFINLKNITIDENNLTIIKVNATDADADTLHYDTNSSFIDLNKTTGSFIVIPDSFEHLSKGESETVTIMLTVSDKDTNSTQELNITVNGKNDAPIANADVYSVFEGGYIYMNVLDNDIDYDNNSKLTISEINSNDLTLNIDKKKILFQADNTFNKLKNNESEIVYFSYKIQDEYNSTSEANVTLTINGKNDAPIVREIVKDEKSLNFTANIEIVDSNTNIKKYIWSLDKNESETDKATFNISYLPAGEHNISLTVIDDRDISSKTITKSFIINNSFEQPKVLDIDEAIVKLELVDFDNDGDLDIFVNTKSTVFWYENQEGNYIKHDVSDKKLPSNTSHVADIDGDGYLDIIYAKNYVGICLNNKDKTFNCLRKDNKTSYTLKEKNVQDDKITSISTSDVSKTGKVDIVVTSQKDYALAFYKNYANKKELLSTDLIDIDGYNSNVISNDSADIDGDKNIDIVVSYADKISYFINQGLDAKGKHKFDKTSIDDSANASSVALVKLYKNQNPYIVATHESKIYGYDIGGNHVEIDNNITKPSFVSSIDMDNDGDIDLVSNSYEENGKILWYENLLPNEFKKHYIDKNKSFITFTQAADINKDDKIDVVSADENGKIYIYLQN